MYSIICKIKYWQYEKCKPHAKFHDSISKDVGDVAKRMKNMVKNVNIWILICFFGPQRGWNPSVSLVLILGHIWRILNNASKENLGNVMFEKFSILILNKNFSMKEHYWEKYSFVFIYIIHKYLSKTVKIFEIHWKIKILGKGFH